MGVPKFFRYISERYPCLSELARDQCIPEFDNLYLDMNGIIHNCSHPDDSNINFSISEEDMFKDIFNYIDKLFFLIKPQKLFFMAVDGVAPRAKMNQQRSRRFRSAKDAELLEQKSIRLGQVRKHERFDTNCITPGTEFMARLHEALRYFIKNKISSDPLWQKCRIILSGHDCPGEGEHKIMDYIRYLKFQKDYNPNTRHCLYGLDADLIILGLCSHELHFVVLREEVKFGRKTKNTSVEETRFFLLHLGLLREYLELEFNELRSIDQTFDIAKLIDDWVLIGFMVGNDFIPHLPCLHISSNALPILYKTYIKVYPTLGGNINENGKLNLERLEKFFAALSDVEFEIFQENYADLKYFEAKKTKNGVDEAFDIDVSEINNDNQDTELAALIESSRQFFEDNDDDSQDEDKHIAEEFETYKRNYYMSKLNQNDMSKALKREQAICYITALQWVLDYYYLGVQSWDWYYPHHYAPFISDLKDFKDYLIRFNLGKPFLPFQQLLAVLPAASKQLLPEAYRDLMTNSKSELINYYPKDFETDLNGKQHEWEAVVLIPFIDEKILLDAMKKCEENLTPTERTRNTHGPMLQYDYTAESQGVCEGVASLKTIQNVFCTEKSVWSKDIAIPIKKSVCVELPNAARTVFFPRFPTMKHLSFDFELKFGRVKVFDYPSRSENMILKPKNRTELNDILTVAEKYLNQVVYIGWPHLIKAKVESVSSKEKFISAVGFSENNPKSYQLHVKAVQDHLVQRMGIEFSDMSVLVHVRTFIGSSFSYGNQGKIVITDAWSPACTAYPAQGIVANIPVHNALPNIKKIEQLYPVGSTVFFVGNPYFGSEGVVLDPLLVYECGRLKVNITVLPEPDFGDAKYMQSRLDGDYINSYHAAATIGLNVKVLGRLTGSILVVPYVKGENPNEIPKKNIGLQFKYPKQQEERVGYARRINNQWFFSSKALSILQAYCDRFPEVLKYLGACSERQEFCYESDLFPGCVGQGQVDKIVDWVNAQDHMKVEKIPCGLKSVDKESVENILEAIEELKNMPVKTVKLQVKPHLLLKPDHSLPEMYKSKRPIKLFDRVVIVRSTYMVPLGAKGTVVGLYPVCDQNPVRLECVKVVNNFYDVLFDKQIPNGSDIHGVAPQRVYKVPEASVLLIFTQDKRNDTQQTAQSDKVVPDNRMNCSSVVRKNTPVSNATTELPTTSKAKKIEANNKKLQQNQQNQKQQQNQNQQQQSQKQQQQQQQKVQKPQQQAAQPQQERPEVFAAAAENFWMPDTVKPKAKYTIMSKNSSATKPLHVETATSSLPQPTLQTPNFFSQVPPDANAGTQALKNLLGLDQNKQSKEAKSSTSTVEPVAQLPPPPPQCWRSDAQNANNLKQKLQHQQSPQYHKQIHHPHQPSHQVYHQPQPQTQQQHGTYSMYPIQPQMSSSMALMYGNLVPITVAPPFIPSYPQTAFYSMPSTQNFFMPNSDGGGFRPDENQKRAFVPLQAPRHQQFSRMNSDQATLERLTQNLTTINLDNSTKAKDIGVESYESVANPAIHNTTLESVAANAKGKKPPRVPKIGAKFDFVN